MILKLIIIGVIAFFCIYAIILFIFERYRIGSYKKLASSNESLSNVQFFQKDDSGICFLADYFERGTGSSASRVLVRINNPESSTERRYHVLDTIRNYQENPDFDSREFLPRLLSLKLVRDSISQRYILQILKFEESKNFRGLVKTGFFRIP